MRQVAALRTLEQEDRAGLIERVAYTWFNRLTALRFLDARGWHPFGARVLTPATPDETQPELLKLVRAGHCPDELQRHTSLDRLNGLLDGRIPSNDPQGEVYRHLVLAACRFYNALLPDLFERLDDETELLLPDDLLTEHSIVQGFRSEITDEDCSEVEMLGWLYQFYISEKKDQVMARKAAVPTADIPAVTQLFTPHWIVRYLVENSLGRLWLLNRPDSLLKAWMPYYIEGEPETDFLRIARPEDIRICDPAVGSGHMLTYAFDLLFVIYEEEGYAPNEIPALILRHNLHGLDICPRAAQLAEMALIFKAREKSSLFFHPAKLVQPHVLALRNVHFAENELRGYTEALRLGDLFNEPMLTLLHQFEEATTFGSLIQPCLDEQQIAFARGFIETKDLGGHLFLHETHQKILHLLDQAEMLAHQCHIVIANPPYITSGNMIETLKDFALKHYPSAKADSYAMFINRGFTLALEHGFLAFVTLQTWMFLPSFRNLREDIIFQYQINSCVHIGYNSFPELNSKIVQAVAFLICKHLNTDFPGRYFDLASAPQSADKQKVFEACLSSNSSYRAWNTQLLSVPGAPLAYWVGPKLREAFQSGNILEDIAPVRQGFQTGDNDRFIRLWQEVSAAKVHLSAQSAEEVFSSGNKWVPYNKGGPFKRWYGNNDFLVAFDKENYDILAKMGNCLPSRKLYFKQGITWSSLTSGEFGARLSPRGFTFSAKGACAFPLVERHNLVLGLLNSCVAAAVLRFFAATMDFNVGAIRQIPLSDLNLAPITSIENVVCELVQIARSDWDNFEISWDFSGQPLLRLGIKDTTLEMSWGHWETQSMAAIHRMHQLETESNRIFIDAYGLSDELRPDIPEEQITLARADARKDIAAFLSYAVGCMMGRYSLDHSGLILANAGESVPEYLAKVGLAQDQLTFAPDEDGIIPVLDGEWFEDDIVARTREFLRATFGEATLRENIRFIEESLGRELRSYFLTDFYKDHLQTYKKRPIYWMIQSPRKGFSVLIYLHRYTRDTMNLVLNRYLREYQVRLRSRIAHLAEVQTSGAVSTRDKTAARKEFDKLTKTLHECEEWERQVVLPLAQARIELDLDDGVKVNYLKLGEALATIPGLAAAED